MRLLLVDDEASIRRALGRFAVRSGIDVVGEAENGRIGVDLAKELTPDCVLMDVRMPEMDGIEATRQIKEALPDTVIVVLSAYDDPSLQQEAAAAGATEWFLKGGSARDLCRRLLDLTGEKSP